MRAPTVSMRERRYRVKAHSSQTAIKSFDRRTAAHDAKAKIFKNRLELGPPM